MSSVALNEIYNQAKRLYQEHKYAEALALLDEAGQADNAKIIFARGKCMARMGRRDEAEALCDRLRTEFNDPRWKQLSAFLKAEDRDKPGGNGHAKKPAANTPAPRVRRSWKGWAARAALAVCLLGIGLAGVAVYVVHARMSNTAPVVAEEVADVAAPEPVSTPEATPAVATASTSASAERRLGGQLEVRGLLGADRNADRSMDWRGGALHLEDRTNTGLVLAQAGTAQAPQAPAKPADTVQPPTMAHPTEFTPVGSIIDLQQFKTAQRLANARGDEAVLTNLSPYIGSWYVLNLNIAGRKAAYHLEVPSLQGDPTRKPLLALYRDGLEVTVDGTPHRFPLWAAEGTPAEASAGAQELNAAPVLAEVFSENHKFASALTAICDGFVLIRTQKPGSATKLEVATDLLRETRIGDWFVEKAKPYLIPPPETGEDHRGTAAAEHAAGEVYPLDARVDETQITLYMTPNNLGIETDAADRKYYYGRWYKALHHPHIFVSMMKPTVVEKAILDSYTDRVGGIGTRDKKRREVEALVYLVAYDLDDYRLGYALGADHPKLDWAPRATQVPHTGPGPDGFNTKAPLCTIGAVPPYYAPLVEATFVGGFKREHAAFNHGPLAKVNNGSHFGFVEQGTIFSRLAPGLATFAIFRDGSMDMLTWPEDDTKLLPRIADARQNCVAIVEGIDENGIPIPGQWVNNWAVGSWSANRDGDFVTLRASAALQENAGHRFLIFAYFTGATPNAMARVFQAYGCRYAMLLDMNTPNYCYMALYTRDADKKVSGVEHLHKDMNAGGGNDGGYKFLAKNDTRDFFYVYRKP